MLKFQSFKRIIAFYWPTSEGMVTQHRSADRTGSKNMKMFFNPPLKKQASKKRIYGEHTTVQQSDWSLRCASPNFFHLWYLKALFYLVFQFRGLEYFLIEHVTLLRRNHSRTHCWTGLLMEIGSIMPMSIPRRAERMIFELWFLNFQGGHG